MVTNALLNCESVYCFMLLVSCLVYLSLKEAYTTIQRLVSDGNMERVFATLKRRSHRDNSAIYILHRKKSSELAFALCELSAYTIPSDWAYAGLLGYNIGLNDRAITLARAYIEKAGSPQNYKEGIDLAFGYTVLADALKKANITEEANQCYTKAAKWYMAVDGNSIATQSRVAHCNFSAKEYKAATYWLERIVLLLRRYPDHHMRGEISVPSSLQRAGLCSYYLKRYKRSRRYLLKSMQIQPKDFNAQDRLCLMESMHRLGDHKGFWKMIREYIIVGSSQDAT